MAPSSPARLVDLSVRARLYLTALMAAQARRLPVAPTLRSSLVVMGTLSELGVIEVPWPELSWPIEPNAERTPLEGLHWRYHWDFYPRSNLLSELERHLASLPRGRHVAARLKVWRELALAEAEAFFHHELRRHHFDPGWSQDLAFVYDAARPTLSISQWRYCCWAAVRHGASVAQRQRHGDLEEVRNAAYLELRRRASRVGAGSWSNCALPPYQLLPESALGRLAAQLLPSLEVYWLSLPTREALRQNH
jgi:hypothetical protein